MEEPPKLGFWGSFRYRTRAGWRGHAVSHAVREGHSPTQALFLVGLLAEIPEEEVWLQRLKSNGAYRADVGDFVVTLRIRFREELHQIRPGPGDPLAKDSRGPQVQAPNHPTEANANRRRGVTGAFGKKEARAILDVPNPEMFPGKRDRAILAVGLQVGLRRNEVAAFIVKDLHMNLGIPKVETGLHRSFVLGFRKKKRTANSQDYRTNQQLGKRVESSHKRWTRCGGKVTRTNSQHPKEPRRRTKAPREGFGSQQADLVRGASRDPVNQRQQMLDGQKGNGQEYQKNSHT